MTLLQAAELRLRHPESRPAVRLSVLALSGLLALAGCGGSGSDSNAIADFKTVVVFGDSLSDVGTYTPVTSLAGDGTSPYLGGKFTTNNDGNADTVWVENIAAELGIPLTPAVMGYATSVVDCPASRVLASAAAYCTGYAQGGARVTDVNGIGHADGALTWPLKKQIETHLARVTSFTANDLVFVYGGNNDVFAQLNAFAAVATELAQQAANGQITAAQAQAGTQEAAADGQVGIEQAATGLATYVKDLILAKGATYVAVANLPDSTATPFGATLPDAAKAVTHGYVQAFNAKLAAELEGTSVLWIDTATFAADALASPATYGLTNVTAPACSAAKISAITNGAVTGGSSLFCNDTTGMPYYGLADGASATTWLFADGVHPTSGGHKMVSDRVLKVLRDANWID